MIYYYENNVFTLFLTFVAFGIVEEAVRLDFIALVVHSECDIRLLLEKFLELSIRLGPEKEAVEA